MTSRATGSRRLALNACDSCRQRKTKCDENKPSCARCQRLQIECVYEETLASRKVASINEVTASLNRIEHKLDQVRDVTASVDRLGRRLENDYAWGALHTNQYYHASSDVGRPGIDPTIPHALNFFDGISTTDPATSEHTPIEIPVGGDQTGLGLSAKHSTALQHLLRWPCSPLKINASDMNYSTMLELKRQRLAQPKESPHYIPSKENSEKNWATSLSLSQIHTLTTAYFQTFHLQHLIIDEDTFYDRYLPKALRTNFGDHGESCVALLVFALGSIAARHSEGTSWRLPDSSDDTETVAARFFHLALSTFHEFEGPDWCTVRCLLLMGVFYGTNLRVYDNWNCIHRACSTIALILPLERQLDVGCCQLFWLAYLQESQILAEFDFPVSRLSQLESIVPLPLIDSARLTAAQKNNQLFLLALIAIRRLLNRIHANIYDNTMQDCVVSPEAQSDSVNSPTSFSRLAPRQTLLYELDRQLEEWRECLPVGFQFERTSTEQISAIIDSYHNATQHQKLMGYLQARYYSAKSILHRPYVYKALHAESDTSLSADERSGAKACLECGILSVLHGGLFREPMALLLYPINLLRAYFAILIQVEFVLRDPSACSFALPSEWQTLYQYRQRIVDQASPMSPTIVRDADLVCQLSNGHSVAMEG